MDVNGVKIGDNGSNKSMAYLNSFIDGARTGFFVLLAIAISNGLYQRLSPTKKTLEGAVSESLSGVGL